jgi:hypothetical protein
VPQRVFSGTNLFRQEEMMTTKLNVLEYLRRQIDGSFPKDSVCAVEYPTAISPLLGFRITEIDAGPCLSENGCRCHHPRQSARHGSR